MLERWLFNQLGFETPVKSCGVRCTLPDLLCLLFSKNYKIMEKNKRKSFWIFAYFN
jgi:hypothetical protein